jgi:hypothetical protein
MDTAQAELFDEYGYDTDSDAVEAIEDLAEDLGGLEYALDAFEDAYCGQWESLEAYAWHLTEECNPELMNAPIGYRIELDMIAWQCDYWISSNGHVFRNV